MKNGSKSIKSIRNIPSVASHATVVTYEPVTKERDVFGYRDAPHLKTLSVLGYLLWAR